MSFHLITVSSEFDHFRAISSTAQLSPGNMFPQMVIVSLKNYHQFNMSDLLIDPRNWIIFREHNLHWYITVVLMAILHRDVDTLGTLRVVKLKNVFSKMVKSKICFLAP